MLAPDSPENRGRKMSNFFRAFRENVELQQVTLSRIRSLYHQSDIPKIQTIKTTVTGAPCSLPVAAPGLNWHWASLSWPQALGTGFGGRCPLGCSSPAHS